MMTWLYFSFEIVRGGCLEREDGDREVARALEPD